MFNKKLISTVLSALTIFPTTAPLVRAIGSQADEQPQPSNTAPASTSETADTGTIPPAQKRPRQAESQADTAAKTDSESECKQLNEIDFHLKKANACLDAIEQFINEFKQNVASNAGYIDSFISPNRFSEPMDKLYKCLGELIVHLDTLYSSATFLRIENNKLKITINDKLEKLRSTVLGTLEHNIMRVTILNSDYTKIYLEGIYSFHTSNNISVIKNLLTKFPKNLKSAHILFYLYAHSIVNFTMEHICSYFLYGKWNIKKPIVLNPESATKHLKETLSARLKELFSHILACSYYVPGHILQQITDIDKILNLETYSTTFNIHANILLDYLDVFESNLKALRIITNPFCISNHLKYIYCYSPRCKTGTPPKGTGALKSKLREVNTLLFKKIEDMNFEKFPQLKETLQRILEGRNSLFDPSLLPDEYYDRFTKKIIEYPRVCDKLLHVRLYKLSVFANILLCTQYSPYKSGIQSLFESLEHQIKKDRSKKANRLSIPDSELKIPPFELKKECLFSEKLLYLEFFNDLIV